MTEQFRHHRFPTAYPVTIYASDAVQRGTVIDVNQSGARLTGLSNLKRGDQITVQVLLDRFRATVRWHGADRTGISFPILLPTRVVETVRYAATAAGSRHPIPGRLQEMR